MADLYIVSMPIGNLQDITLRAIKTLFSVDIVACEDTRKTYHFLQWIGLQIKQGRLHIDELDLKREPRLISFFEGNEEKRVPQFIKLLKQGKSVALVSNAGTPTISDPGFKLVRECVQQGIKVTPVPGASALLAALVSSGLPNDKFLFLGYLPKKAGKRKRLFESLKTIQPFNHLTIIFYESPYRLTKTLDSLQEVFGNINITIACELTKPYERVWKGSLSTALKEFAKPKGEHTILINIPLR